jgi:outer membrane protein
MKNIKLFTFLILFTCSVFSQNNIWTLEECVQHALENNISILQAKNSLLSSEQDIVSAKGNFLPAVSSNISGGASLGNIEVFPGEFRDREFYSTSLGVGFSQSVFNGFRNINLLNQSKLSLERNQYELEKLKDDISLNVANAYLNVLFNKENLELAKSQLKFSKFQVQQVTIMVESGSEPMSTLIETQATYSRDIQSLTIAENNQDLALLTLSQLLQLPYDDFDVEIIQIECMMILHPFLITLWRTEMKLR